MSDPISDLLIQNLWDKSMWIFIFNKHSQGILLYIDVWEPLM